ncbi:sugar phosphate permease [Dongia mobilis]|uniref:Sugar phosphate permease n=1 Tax=Dongia mobilis TaxID=578943 RepID=A0A4R6WQ90_9PROT|nr:MFS transporter [Dongia mobilis]TDQ83384.1 sugar phosphate permease [Dongia mobilis]
MTISHSTGRGILSPVEATLLFTAFVASAYGFGIYLFASLAADMRGDLGLGYGDIGLATGVAQAGFLAASLLSGIWATRLGPVRVILGSAAATALSLLLMSRLPAGDALWHLTGLLTVMGAGAASVWVPMVAVAQDVIPARHRAKALGLMSSGTAYGVFVNGLVIPPIVATGGWRGVWVAVGIAACSLLLVGLLRLRRLPVTAAMAVQRTGRPAEAGAEAGAVAGAVAGRWGEIALPRTILLVITMFCTGLACMPFQTYLVATLREELGASLALASSLWSVIGAIGMASGFLFGLLADRISVKWAMVAAYLLLSGAAALLLALLLLALPIAMTAMLAVSLFALAFYAIFGLVPAYISLVHSPGAATLLFGLGNIALGFGGLVGNVAGGHLRETTGSFAAIYAVILAAALLQVLLALLTPNERRHEVAARGGLRNPAPESETASGRCCAGGKPV